jgi:hypothetical protein
LPLENLDGRSIPVLTQEWITILARQDGSETLVAETADQNIIGFVTGGPVRERKHPIIVDLSGITAEVSLLYVLPEHMGKGSAARYSGAARNGLRVSAIPDS